MQSVAKLRAHIAHAMRARGLPTPATATKAAAGWAFVTLYATLYQISARVCVRAHGPDARPPLATCFA